MRCPISIFMLLISAADSAASIYCPEPDRDRDRTVDSPLCLTCHKAARNDIDPLQHPDAAADYQQNTYNRQQ
jgi:hypothetical protein